MQRSISPVELPKYSTIKAGTAAGSMTFEAQGPVAPSLDTVCQGLTGWLQPLLFRVHSQELTEVILLEVAEAK
ncbi:UNVERIFIED_CONTAM: hypothetical protein FKN15_064947 [Acipenser sinensis]